MIKKSYPRPPDKPGKIPSVNPLKPKPPDGPSWGQPPADLITGGMTVEITIGEVSVTITGPMLKVIAVMNWLFGSGSSPAAIANLQLVFGPEVKK